LGAGVAGLSAAIAAAEDGARVILLEKAPAGERGGNTRFSDAQLRFPHGADEYSPVTTTADQFAEDFRRVTNGRANPELVQVLVEQAAPAIAWLTAHGVTWARGFPHTATYRRKPTGGGRALVDALFSAAEAAGVRIRYEAAARDLMQDSRGRVVGARALGPDGFVDFLARSGVVLATGGYQASPELRVRYLGPWAESLIVRGSRHDTGEGLQMALAVGAQSAGQWGDYHSAVIDARSPRVEGGVTAIYIYQLGIIVNRLGERFVDEGEDFRDNTYVKFSKQMVQQPGGLAFCVFDQQARRDPEWEVGIRTISATLVADSLPELARRAGLPLATFRATVEAFNDAVDRAAPFDPDRRDGKATRGLHPPKSNWARPIEEPPFLAYAVTGGITFPFGGLKTDARGRVLDGRDRPIPGLYAAGEVQGEFFYDNYPGATSVLRGCVFGQIAGRNAAQLGRDAQGGDLS
jgi:tricarballylate dehydrogenase